MSAINTGRPSTYEKAQQQVEVHLQLLEQLCSGFLPKDGLPASMSKIGPGVLINTIGVRDLTLSPGLNFSSN